MSAAALTVERRRAKNAAAQKAAQAVGLDCDVIDDKIEQDAAEEEEVEYCVAQRSVRELYDTPITQFSVAFLIFLNFIAEAAYAQILPDKGSGMETTFLIFEYIFNFSFTIELIWNIYGSWFFRFWQSGWNWFDFIIVIISLLAMMFPELPGITVLRLFRAFRVFRLFKRIKSLKKIIEGVFGALPGVMHAFLVLGVLMGIWSVIAVEFFKDHMPEEFGTFVRSMYTMWQIMTMDSWSSGIARVLIYEKGLWLASLFFISYIFIAGIVMTNVVVAILLDKYLEAIDKDKEESNRAEVQGDGKDGEHEHLNVHINIKNHTIGQISLSRLNQLKAFLTTFQDGDTTMQALVMEKLNDPDEFPGELIAVNVWSIELVGQWLLHIEFGDFVDTFREEEVNGNVLCKINEADLIHLGMKLGKRKEFMDKLMDLISEQEDSCSRSQQQQVLGALVQTNGQPLSLWEPAGQVGQPQKRDPRRAAQQQAMEMMPVRTNDNEIAELEETFIYKQDAASEFSVHHFASPKSPPKEIYR